MLHNLVLEYDVAGRLRSECLFTQYHPHVHIAYIFARLLSMVHSHCVVLAEFLSFSFDKGQSWVQFLQFVTASCGSGVHNSVPRRE